MKGGFCPSGGGFGFEVYQLHCSPSGLLIRERERGREREGEEKREGERERERVRKRERGWTGAWRRREVKCSVAAPQPQSEPSAGIERGEAASAARTMESTSERKQVPSPQLPDPCPCNKHAM